MSKMVILRRFETEQEAYNYRYLAQQIYIPNLHVEEIPDQYNPGKFAVYYLR